MSFIKISSAASELLPSLDLNLSAQNAWAPNTFFDEYENYKMEFDYIFNKNYNFEKYEKRWVELMDNIIEKHGSWETRKGHQRWHLMEVA